MNSTADPIADPNILLSANPASTASPPPTKNANDLTFSASLRRVLHTAVFFVVIFLFLRTFALEPFGVPTGSMATTLFGNHREMPCPRCGYRLIVGDSSMDRAPRGAETACPNCQLERISMANSAEVPGDRLLVDKMIYTLRSPRRWEMSVFRCPVDDTKPYVKRVIGLPGEAIQIIGGDIFANQKLQRKTLSQIRETRIPFLDMNYPPTGGWRSRWFVEPVVDDLKLPRNRESTSKMVDESILHDNALHLTVKNADEAVGLTYRHCQLENQLEDPVNDALTYNGSPRRSKSMPVHDFILCCDLEVVSGSGAFACRLGDGRDSVKVEFLIDGPTTSTIRLSQDGQDPYWQERFSYTPGKPVSVEFALVDRSAHLALEGRTMGRVLELPAEPGTHENRGAVSRPLQMGTRGVSVVVRNLRLYRDIHYRAEGMHATTSAYRLPPDQYFMLGDNPANSLDSREWSIPGVPERDFIGKPFLVHQPLKPARITISGRERVFQTVDWSRLRWVR